MPNIKTININSTDYALEATYDSDGNSIVDTYVKKTNFGGRVYFWNPETLTSNLNSSITIPIKSSDTTISATYGELVDVNGNTHNKADFIIGDIFIVNSNKYKNLILTSKTESSTDILTLTFTALDNKFAYSGGGRTYYFAASVNDSSINSSLVNNKNTSATITLTSSSFLTLQYDTKIDISCSILAVGDILKCSDNYYNSWVVTAKTSSSMKLVKLYNNQYLSIPDNTDNYTYATISSYYGKNTSYTGSGIQNVTSIYGGSYGKFVTCCGWEKSQRGWIGFYTSNSSNDETNSLIVGSSGEDGYWASQLLSVSVFVPPGVYYYLKAEKMSWIKYNTWEWKKKSF